MSFWDDLIANFIVEGTKPMGGPPRNNPFWLLEEEKKMERIKQVSSKINQLRTGSVSCTKPVPGTPVYCNLAVAFEHTGIYIGNNQIAHLNGDGLIEAVSPGEFIGRLDGSNPAMSIYFAEYGGKSLGRSTIADRARSMISSRRDYKVLFDNCHQFTCGCISGDFENPCNYFWMVKMEIKSKFGTFSWKEWNY